MCLGASPAVIVGGWTSTRSKNADGRGGGENWTEDFQRLPGGANVSIILESTSEAGVGPRLHEHPYAETFIVQARLGNLHRR